MPRTKKPVRKVKAPRKDAYSRAHEFAQKRLVRAKDELVRYSQKLQALQVEIPHLEGIIRALGPKQPKDTDRPHAVPVVEHVPAELAKYAPPSLDGVGSIPPNHDPEDDKFLPDV